MANSSDEHSHIFSVLNRPNPSESVSVQSVLKRKVIQLPGCPCHPDWFIGTLAHFLLHGEPVLDASNRPVLFYGTLIHDLCPRRSYFVSRFKTKRLLKPKPRVFFFVVLKKCLLEGHYITYSWYDKGLDSYKPLEIIPEDDQAKAQGYSWVKAPRYNQLPFEVGPLARQWLSGAYSRGISMMDRTIAPVRDIMNGKMVMGIGNLLMKDDGIGVYVVKELSKQKEPAGC